MATQDIFYKSEKASKKFSFEQLNNIIPKNTYDHPQENMRSDKNNLTEWRMRKYQINNIIYYEFSFIQPNEKNNKRLYLNNECQYVEKEIDSSYDKYVIEEKYWYTLHT